MRIIYWAGIRIEKSGGPSRHVLSLLREFVRRGHRVVLFARSIPDSVCGGLSAIFAVPERILGIRIPQRCTRQAHRILGHIVTALFRPDVIYQRDRPFDNVPLELSRVWRIPVVIEVNGWAPRDLGLATGNERLVQKAIAALTLRYQHAHAIIASSPGLRDLIVASTSVDPERVFHVNNGVDIDGFRPPVPYKPRVSGDIIVGFVGGLHVNHDVSTILKAISLLRASNYPIELRFVSYYPDISVCQDEAIALGVDSCVRFVTGVQHDQIPKHLWEMDIALAVFTRSCIEQTKSIEAAMKLWEYWASQRPVIATDVPSSYSYIHHLERRYLAVEPEDPQALAQAIKTIVDNPDLATELALNGYHYVQKGHSWADRAEQVESILKNVVSSFHARPLL